MNELITAQSLPCFLEGCRIGPHIVVTILGVNGSQVRLGIEAPKDVTVHREEVFERIKHEKNTAGNS